jgi:hypothetical protein
VLKIKPDGRPPRVKSNVRNQKRPPTVEAAGGKGSRAGAGRSLDLDAEDPVLNSLGEDQVNRVLRLFFKVDEQGKQGFLDLTK